jgi:hypothetical protein
MKPLPNAPNNNKCYFLVCIAVFTLFAYLLTAFFNKEFLAWADEISLFLPTRLFFLHAMQTAGGLLGYGGTFLTQFFYYPLLGTAILILLLLSVVFLVIKTVEFSPRFYPLAFIPALALLVSITGTGYALYSLKSPGYLFSNTLGVIVCLSLLKGYGMVSKKYPAKSFILYLFPLVVALTYPLFGFYSLLAAFMCMIYVPYVLYLIPLLFLIPYFFSRYIYTSMAWSDTFTAALPQFFFTQAELILWLPFIVLFLSLLLFLQNKKKKYKETKLSRPVAMGIFLLSLAGAYSLTYRNDNFKTELQMTQAIDENDWNKALSITKKQKGKPTRLIILCHNLALYKLGQAGDRMFAMDNNSVMPVSPRTHLILMHNGAKQVYYQYGKVNYAYRWCMEDMVEYGMTVQSLKYMVKCALMNDEIPLAKKYNAVLKQTFFHRRWADKYQKYIDNPDLMAENAEFKSLRPLMAYQNQPDGDKGKLELYILNSFASMEGGTPEIIELSLQCNLVLKNIDRFWPRFFLYARNHDRIPVHYQEAALLYSHLERKVDVSRMNFDPAIIERFKRFLTMAEQYVNQSEENNKKTFKPQFGKTFWYYYFFVTDIKTN